MGEYGSTAEVQGSHRNGRKSVMIAICAASMLLALAALAVDQAPDAQERLQVANAGRTTMLAAAAARVAAKAAAAKVVASPKPAAAVAAAAPKKVAAVAAVAAPVKKTAAVAAKKAVAPPVKKAVAAPVHKAAVVAVKQQRLAAAKPTPAIAKGKMLDDEAPAEDEAAEAPAADDAAPDAEAPAEGEEEAAAPAPAEQDDASEGDAAAASDDGAEEPKPEGVVGDDVGSEIGTLKPTGIMGVFFNEKIMITAVCVIAFLLLAICCFAKYGDCALT